MRKVPKLALWTQGWSKIMIMKSDKLYIILVLYFLVIMFIYVNDLIQKLELCLLVTYIFNKN